MRLSAQTRGRRPAVRRRMHAGGFTLIEAALTTVIVGTGVLAIVAAQQAYHMKNDWAQRTGTAMLLANELRELTLSLPMHDPITGKAHLGPEPDELTVADYDDLDDFAGVVVDGRGTGTTFNPPINALRGTVDGMDRWSQEIHVTNVDLWNISAARASCPPLTADTSMVRVHVSVMYQGPMDEEPSTITELTWVVGRR